jgi:hypothetical protein
MLAHILLGAGFALDAQSRPTVIYVEPVSGTGSGPGDNEYFAGLIAKELEEMNYTVVGMPLNAAFTLRVVITPHDIRGETFMARMYVLHLGLWNNRTGEPLMNQDLFYTNPHEIAGLLTMILSRLPLEPGVSVSAHGANAGSAGEEPDAWSNRQWYFTASAFWSPHTYAAEATSTYYVNFGFGLYAEYHFVKFAAGKLKFLKYLSVGTGLELIPDWVAVSDMPNDSYRDLVLEIPLLIQFVIKPSGHFMLTPYAGINLNLALYGETIPPLFAWRVGFQYGVKAGPGIIVIDPWFSMDIGKSRLGMDLNDNISYQRYMMHIAIGYKYGLPGK